MKNKTSGFFKQILSNLSSMAKSKTMALKSKTEAIRARLIIFSLMKNKKFLMSSLSEKFHSVLGQSSRKKEEECLLEDGNDGEKSKAIVLHNAHSHGENQLLVEQDQDGYEYDGCYYNYEYHDENGKYPDLRHTLFESDHDHDHDQDLDDFGGSVIDLVKNSQEEAGKEFKLEDEIDFAADLFIKKFRNQIVLQKQESLKRKREMDQQKGA